MHLSHDSSMSPPRPILYLTTSEHVCVCACACVCVCVCVCGGYTGLLCLSMPNNIPVSYHRTCMPPKHTFSLSFSPSLSHTHTHTHTCAHAYSRTHTHTRARAHTHIRTHARTHTQNTHTNTPTYTNTHTYRRRKDKKRRVLGAHKYRTSGPFISPPPHPLPRALPSVVVRPIKPMYLCSCLVTHVWCMVTCHVYSCVY